MLSPDPREYRDLSRRPSKVVSLARELRELSMFLIYLRLCPRKRKVQRQTESRHCSHLSRHLGLQRAHSATERARYHFRGNITAADPPNLERANALTKVRTKHFLRRTSVAPPNAPAIPCSCNRRKLVNLVEGVDEKVGGNGRFKDSVANCKLWRFRAPRRNGTSLDLYV